MDPNEKSVPQQKRGFFKTLRGKADALSRKVSLKKRADGAAGAAVQSSNAEPETKPRSSTSAAMLDANGTSLRKEERIRSTSESMGLPKPSSPKPTRPPPPKKAAQLSTTLKSPGSPKSPKPPRPAPALQGNVSPKTGSQMRQGAEDMLRRPRSMSGPPEPVSNSGKAQRPHSVHGVPPSNDVQSTHSSSPLAGRSRAATQVTSTSSPQAPTTPLMTEKSHAKSITEFSEDEDDHEDSSIFGRSSIRLKSQALLASTEANINTAQSGAESDAVPDTQTDKKQDSIDSETEATSTLLELATDNSKAIQKVEEDTSTNIPEEINTALNETASHPNNIADETAGNILGGTVNSESNTAVLNTVGSGHIVESDPKADSFDNYHTRPLSTDAAHKTHRQDVHIKLRNGLDATATGLGDNTHVAVHATDEVDNRDIDNIQQTQSDDPPHDVALSPADESKQSEFTIATSSHHSRTSKEASQSEAAAKMESSLDSNGAEKSHDLAPTTIASGELKADMDLPSSADDNLNQSSRLSMVNELTKGSEEMSTVDNSIDRPGSHKSTSRKDRFSGIELGARVKVEGYDGYGIVRYVGNRHARKENTARIGVELDLPGVGKNSGVIEGHEYFKCAPYSGVLVKPRKVTVVDSDSVISQSAVRAAVNSREWIPQDILIEFERITLYSMDIVNEANIETCYKFAGYLTITVVLFGITTVLTLVVYILLIIIGIVLGAVMVGMPNYKKIAAVKLVLPPQGISEYFVSKSLAGPKVPKLDNRLTGSPIIDEEINAFVDLLLRDYVDYWFSALTSHQKCPLEMRRMLQHMIIVVSNHCKTTDWVSLSTNSFIDDFKTHVRLYREAQIESSKELDTDATERSEKRDKRDRAKFNVAQGPAANAAALEKIFFDKEKTFSQITSDRNAEAIYCRNIAEVLCFLLLPQDDFNDRTVRLLLRELLTKNMLLYTADIFSDSDYVNQTIAMSISNSSLTFAAIQAAANYCSAEELKGIRENIDMDIDYRLKGESQFSGSIAENAQRNKKEIEELLALKRLCDRRIQLFEKGVEELDTVTQADGGIGMDIQLSHIFDDDRARQLFESFLEITDSLPLLAFYNSVEWYRQSENEDSLRFTIGDRVTVDNFSTGRVCFVGPSHRNGKLVVGVELDTAIGNCDGNYEGYSYFHCEANKGVVANADVVNKLDARDQSTAGVSGEKDEQQRKKLASDILSRFIHTNDGRRLGLPEEMISKIKTRISDERYKVHLSLFDEPQLFVFRHLETMCLPQFKESKFFEDVIDLGLTKPRENGRAESFVEHTENLFTPEAFEVGGTWRAALTQAFECNEEGQKRYTAYVIKVVYISPGGDRREWKTQRRYSEFDNFHKMLQERFPDSVEACELSLPSKKLFGNMSKDFIKKRGDKLIEWLARLTSNDFLDRDPQLVPTISKFLMQGAFEKEAKRKRSERRELGRKSSRKGGDYETEFDIDEHTIGSKGGQIDDDDDDKEELPLRIMLSLFDDIFELRGNRWMRRAVKTVLARILRGFFGDRVNHMVHDTINHALEPDQVASFVRRQREEVWWPDGVLAPDPPARDAGSQIRTQIEARAKIFALLPDEIKKLVGTRTARTGVNNLFEIFQNKRVTKRLFYAMLETTLTKVFPGHFDKVFQQTHQRVAQDSEKPDTTKEAKDGANADT